MLANKSLLVYVRIDQFTGKRMDAVAQRSVETEFKADAGAGKYIKNLLPNCTELEHVQRCAGRIRKFFQSRTFPWFSDGARIVSSAGYLEFTREFNKLRADFDIAVRDFCAVYEQHKAVAEQHLGDLFDASEYPDAAQIQSAFRCKLTVSPVPDGTDFRTQVTDTERAEYVQAQADVEQAARRECWERLSAVVSKAAEVLAKPDARFKATLLSNVTEVCELLPKLQITDDADLEQVRSAAAAVVAHINPDLCRDSSTARAAAADALRTVESNMAIFMGGTK